MFVSVIVPSYNHAPYLKERIDSILQQSYSNFELILLDDLSPDNSSEILETYKNHPKVSHCIINEQNSGSTFHQWNKGIALARGELIWIAESDDIASPEFLEKLVPQFDHNPSLVLAYSQSYRMSSEGVVTGDWKDHTDSLDAEQFSHDFHMNGWEYIDRFLNTKNTVPNASAVLFRKQTYLDVGKACSHLNLIGDWSIWAKIISQGELFFSSECLNYFRYHTSSVIAKAQKTAGPFKLRRQVIQFRLEISKFWESHKNSNPTALKIYQDNQKHLFKEVNRNCSFAVRRRHFHEIIPTAQQALQILPVYSRPVFILKFTVKLVYSVIIDAPIQKIVKKNQS
ncbi:MULTISPECIES: glycosyltransferase family 2 protein [Acinetobacter]|uniref:glycosyltransferase family 2 protein n=1 Tax=Acinetobacter TaxID=469 RepID=UPI000B3C680B|nr:MULTISPECIES: glycosyltransferase family A protein [Acinetobacter]AXY61088.1 glycosyltransferase family 2 protein [Acinetobacter sp. WCHAc010052]WOE42132.1 glycosyltransferase family A protein [Acinetobacter chinensis]